MIYLSISYVAHLSISPPSPQCTFRQAITHTHTHTHLLKEWAAGGVKEVHRHLPPVHLNSRGSIVNTNGGNILVHEPLLTVPLDQATLG